jgi:hypothetical protein
MVLVISAVKLISAFYTTEAASNVFFKAQILPPKFVLLSTATKTGENNPIFGGRLPPKIAYAQRFLSYFWRLLAAQKH